MNFLLEMLVPIEAEITIKKEKRMTEDKFQSIRSITVNFNIPKQEEFNETFLSRRKKLEDYRTCQRDIRPIRMLFRLDEIFPMYVNREDTIGSSIEQLINFDPKDLMSLGVEFISEYGKEEGLDWGGLTKEYLFFVNEQLCNPDSIDFPSLKPYKSIIETFQGHSLGFPLPDANPNFYLFYGRIISLALYNGFQIALPLNLCLIKAALGESLNATEMDSLYENFEKTLLYPVIHSDDIDDWCLDFTRTSGSSIIPLIPNGEEISVTEENKMEYLKELVLSHLGQYSKEAIRAFSYGLKSVVPEELFQFTAEEIILMVNGEALNISDLKAHCRIKLEDVTENESTQLVDWFWEIAEESTPEQQTSLFAFVTGQGRVPVGGAEQLDPPFTLHFKGERDESFLPEAHSCFNVIIMPVYNSKQQMFDKLQQAVIVRAYELS